MTDGWRVEIIYEDLDLTELRTSASNGTFSGTTNLYLSRETLSDLANILRGFPASRLDNRFAELGAFGAESAGGGLSARFYCSDSHGHSYAEIRIEADHESHGPVQLALISLPIEASAVDVFVDGLRKMASGDSREAHLSTTAPSKGGDN